MEAPSLIGLAGSGLLLALVLVLARIRGESQLVEHLRFHPDMSVFPQELGTGWLAQRRIRRLIARGVFHATQFGAITLDEAAWARRRHRRVLAAALISGALLLVFGSRAFTLPAGTPASCDDLSGVTPFTQFRYGQIQGIFDTLSDPKDPDSGLCTSCHAGSTGAGNLGLGEGFSYANLINVPSPFPGANILRVQPGSANDSLLFQKLNCDDPEVGFRMPPGTPLSLTQQRFFRDWIELGAPLSRLGFEDR
jgi:hypothetical protein